MGALSAHADDTAAAAAPGTLSPVAQALSKAQILNGKQPNLAAEYYIYVQSASWCGPCKLEMPHLIEQYPQMKEGNVEVILVDLDNTAEQGKAYLEGFQAPFPGVHMEDPAVKALPGYELARAVPHATIVDAQGRLVAKGHGSLARKWQQITETDREDL